MLYSQKLIGIPKDESNVRAIMMVNAESKLIWSVFIHSRYKKSFDDFLNQYGSKTAGCEKIIHRTRCAVELKSDFDLCISDATKAYYNLSRVKVLEQVKGKYPLLL